MLGLGLAGLIVGLAVDRLAERVRRALACRETPARSWTEYNVTIDRGQCVLPGGTSVRA